MKRLKKKLYCMVFYLDFLAYTYTVQGIYSSPSLSHASLHRSFGNIVPYVSHEKMLSCCLNALLEQFYLNFDYKQCPSLIFVKQL